MLPLSKLTRPGVGQYISEPSALDYLDDKLNLFSNPVVVTGEKSYQAFLKHYKGNHHFTVLQYDRSASHENMSHLASLAPEGTDVILGIGGGKALDTAKGVAEILNIDYILIPTVLGTCAAYTPLSVVYHLDHSFKTIDYYPRAATICLVDLTLLLESPVNYFMGGIGDTLAKWYEAIVIAEHLPKPWSAMITMGLNSAKLTQEILLRDTTNAIMSLKQHTYSEAFHRIVDAIIAVAGSVGGFAGEYGRISGAHAIHNGMSLVHETHSFEHGLKVAYGILVQLATLNETEELHRLINFYRANHFPTKLSQFGVKSDIEAKMKIIAEFATSDNESFRLAKPDVTAKEVYLAMQQVEFI